MEVTECDITTTESAAVIAAAELIDAAVLAGEREPTLPSLARELDIQPARLRQVFTARLGLTPKAYADARRASRLRDELATGAAVSDAIHAAGYGSVSRVYERHGILLGMTPARYRRGAPGEVVGYTFADTSLGRLIVGTTDEGVCYIAFGSGDEGLLGELAARFARAEILPAGEGQAELVKAVVALVEGATDADIPLDMRGTAFQRLVWDALTRIEPGETITYAELARRIGRPTAVRAVAQACGANPVAVAVPCHRVIGADGALTGYRWGVERKRTLLERERR